VPIRRTRLDPWSIHSAPIRRTRAHPCALWDMTSLQKRTAETPRAQRALKTNHDGCVVQHAGA